MKKTSKVVLVLSRKDARLLARFLDAACQWDLVGKMGDVVDDVHVSLCDQVPEPEKTCWSTKEDRKRVLASQASREGVK